MREQIFNAEENVASWQQFGRNNSHSAYAYTRSRIAKWIPGNMNFRLTDVPEILSTMDACVNYRSSLAGAWNRANEHYAAAVIRENIFMSRVQCTAQTKEIATTSDY